MGDSFVHSTAVRKGETQGEWLGFVNDSYNVIQVPNGGYLMAILVRALKTEQAHNDPNGNIDCLNLSCTFANSANANKDCRILITPIKRGRKVSSLEAKFFQGDSLKIFAVALFGKYDTSTNKVAKRVLFKNRVAKNPRLGPLNAGEAIFFGMGSGAKKQPRAIFDRFQYRMQPMDHAVFSRMMSSKDGAAGVPEPCPAEYRTWIRHEKNADPISVESLVQIVDCGIPTVKAVLPFGDAGWVPTLQMDTTFYREPRAGMEWTLAHFYLESHSGDRMVEACDIYDPETTELLCTAKQIGLIGIVQQKKPKL